jgi:hypothetical protein
MPLEHRSSPAALHRNMHTLFSEIGRSPHVQSRAQAIAIGLATQRRAAAGKANGGGVADYDDGGAVDGGLAMAAPVPGVMNGSPMAGTPMSRAEGGFSMAKAPHLSTPWFSRQQARPLHTGPVLSSVPGRTDHHPVRVPSGSYVIPADVVSGRGQGNTIAGTQALQRMFKMGPFGSSIPKLGHGSLPKPPKPPKPFASGGLADQPDEDDRVGEPVPVNIAGGEVVVPPQHLLEVVHPDLETAHKIMDAWILHERSKLIKTLKKLPGPAKD